MDRSEALAIKERAQAVLFQDANVRMVGYGIKVVRNRHTDIRCIRVFVKKKLPLAEVAPDAVIPAEFERLPTDVEEWGEVSMLEADDDPLPPDDALQRLQRPLVAAIKLTNVRSELHRFSDVEGQPLGTSIGTFFGTIGCFVRSTKPGENRICALTCHHVTNPTHRAAGVLSPDLEPGREIFQPVPFQGPDQRPKKDSDTEKECFCGCVRQQETRRIGRVLRATNSAKVDASLIALKGGLEYRQQLLDLQGLLGAKEGLVGITGSRKRVNPTTPVFQVGDIVWKAGYRTGTMRGIISAEQVVSSDATVDDELGPYRAPPINAFIVDAVNPNDPDDKIFALAGDSGCVVIDADKKVVGLLWGGRSKTVNHLVTESHGLVDPIDIVEAEMLCEVLAHDPGTPVKTTDSNNLDGVPHIDEEGNPVQESASASAQAVRVLEELRAREKGERLAAIAERNVREVVDLLHSSSKLRRVWLGNSGPALAGSFLWGMTDLEARIPAQLWGQPLERCAERICAELSKLGSTELQASLRAVLPAMKRGGEASFDEVLQSLEQALCPPSP